MFEGVFMWSANSAVHTWTCGEYICTYAHMHILQMFIIMTLGLAHPIVGTRVEVEGSRTWWTANQISSSAPAQRIMGHLKLGHRHVYRILETVMCVFIHVHTYVCNLCGKYWALTRCDVWFRLINDQLINRNSNKHMKRHKSDLQTTADGGKKVPPRRFVSSTKVHSRQKSRCKDCGGSGLCEHKRQKSRCKDCQRAHHNPA